MKSPRSRRAAPAEAGDKPMSKRKAQRAQRSLERRTFAKDRQAAPPDEVEWTELDGEVSALDAPGEAEPALAPRSQRRRRENALPVVALVGRPNVGKSTLFNRLVGHRAAIVQDLPGVTRDRHYREVTLAERELLLVDTGGFEPKTNDDMLTAMRQQTELAIEEAHLVVLVTDAAVGLRPEDKEIARRLRKAQKPVIVAVNKIDRAGTAPQAFEFHQLGFDGVLQLSAEHGAGVKDLAQAIAEALPSVDKAPTREPEKVAEAASESLELCSVAVVGRPNVGKSSLVNQLLGAPRHLATPIAGTTRDSIDSLIEHQGETLRFIDTAGIRRKSRISDKLEEFMIMSALRSVQRADVVVLVLDAAELATDQEAKIAALCHERGKGLILAVNKWDLPHDGLDAKNLKDELVHRFPFLSYARVVYMSAKTGQGVSRLFEEIRATVVERERRVSTGDLNRFLGALIEHHPPRLVRGRRGKIYYGAQVRVAPPTFAFKVNDATRFQNEYLRYLVNALRERYGFAGTPIVLRLRHHHPERDGVLQELGTPSSDAPRPGRAKNSHRRHKSREQA